MISFELGLLFVALGVIILLIVNPWDETLETVIYKTTRPVGEGGQDEKVNKDRKTVYEDETYIPNTDIKIYLISIQDETSFKVLNSIKQIKMSINNENIPINLVKGVIHEKNEIGCKKAHYNLWEKISKSDKDGWFVIFEDDVMFNVDSDMKIQQLLTFGKKHNADAIQLGMCGNTGSGSGSNIIIRGFSSCAHAYAVTKQGALNAMKAIDSKPLRKPVDLCLQADKEFSRKSIRIKMSELKVYNSDPSIRLVHCKSGVFCQNRGQDSKSDINN